MSNAQFKTERLARIIQSCTTEAQLRTCNNWLTPLLSRAAMTEIRKALRQRRKEILSHAETNRNRRRPLVPDGNRLRLHHTI